jgi:multicomponent Na+:H+ antiporter subunit F
MNSIDLIVYIAIGIMSLAMLLGLIRFLIGPTVIDRVIAFDALTITSLVIIGVIAVLSNRMIYLDVAIVYGLLSFLGVIVVAKYIQRGL